MVRSMSVIVGLVIFFTGSMFSDIGNIGVRDWDQHLFYFSSVMKTVFEHGQLPLWNPWYCGGSVLYQNPQVSLLSPVYLVAPIVGLLPAVKITVALYYCVALFGMYLLARTVYGLSNSFMTLLACCVFVFSGSLSMHIAEGQTHMLAVAFFPFVLLGYELYLARNQPLWLIFGSAFLALILWSGGIYAGPLITLFIVAYALLRAAIEKSMLPLRGLLVIGIYAFLFSALRLVPVMDYMRDYPRIVMAREFIPPGIWYDIFFSRGQSLFTEATLTDSSLPIGWQPQWGWHEYGSYVGIPIVVILGAAFVRTGLSVRDHHNQGRDLALLVCWLGFFALFVGDFALANPYRLLKQFPFFRSFHVTGRFLIPLMFVSSLVILCFFRWVQDLLAGRKLVNYAVAVACVLVVGDLMLETRRPLGEAFTVDPAVYHRSAPIDADSGHSQAIASLQILAHHSISSMYPAILVDVSTVKCYEPLKPRKGYELDKPLVFSPDAGISISNIVFSPNRITFDLDVDDYGWVVLNQNFVRGWSLTGTEAIVRELGHKPAVRISPGSYKDISFRFFPASIWWGLALTSVGVVVALKQLVSSRSPVASMHQ